MAFTELRTDYKDDELNESVNTNVVFIETDLDSGDTRNISLQDATSYTQMGDQLSASVLNQIGTVVNDIGSHVTAAENTLSNILNVFYPVGSYYETSDLYFDPAVAWGGTWVLEIGGQVHVSAGSGYSINHANDNSGAGAKDGGSPYIQEHTHGFTNPSTNGTGTASITGGGHTHSLKYRNDLETASTGGANRRFGPYADSSSGSVYTSVTSSNTTHTHSLPAHTHTTSGGSVNAVKDVSAGQGGNYPPYIVVNRWHRTG